MTHVVVGYPSLDANMAMLEAMQRAEVDVVEFQLPFSEPIADGPVLYGRISTPWKLACIGNAISSLCSVLPLHLTSRV